MGNLVDFKRKSGGSIMPSIFDVARYYLSIEPMTNKKLQKLCYYTQAWFLAFYKRNLFGERFEAWVHGPVCPDLYQVYKKYGWNVITHTEEVNENIDGFNNEFLKNVYSTYGKFSGDQLEILSHNEVPWQLARRGYEEWETSHEKIDEKVMEGFYWSKYEQSQQV